MSEAVRNMFGTIASRYDLANDVLSFGVHRLWRQSAVEFSGIKPGQKVLDLCTGTGDLAFCMAKRVGQSGSVLGLDFVPEMVELAKKKREQVLDKEDSRSHVVFRQGDAMKTECDENDFDLACVAFGIRNVDCPLTCLKEMSRVVKPGGKILVVEFGQPSLWGFSALYRFYSKHIMPLIGGLVSGNRQAYEYLPETSKNFPAGKNFVEIIKQAKLVNIKVKPYLAGVAYAYLAEVPKLEAQNEAA